MPRAVGAVSSGLADDVAELEGCADAAPAADEVVSAAVATGTCGDEGDAGLVGVGTVGAGLGTRGAGTVVIGGTVADGTETDGTVATGVETGGVVTVGAGTVGPGGRAPARAAAATAPARGRTTSTAADRRTSNKRGWGPGGSGLAADGQNPIDAAPRR